MAELSKEVVTQRRATMAHNKMLAVLAGMAAEVYSMDGSAADAMSYLKRRDEEMTLLLPHGRRLNPRRRPPTLARLHRAANTLWCAPQ